jgi:hypothetical protein
MYAIASIFILSALWVLSLFAAYDAGRDNGILTERNKRKRNK